MGMQEILQIHLTCGYPMTIRLQARLRDTEPLFSAMDTGIARDLYGPIYSESGNFIIQNMVINRTMRLILSRQERIMAGLRSQVCVIITMKIQAGLPVSTIIFWHLKGSAGKILFAKVRMW